MAFLIGLRNLLGQEPAWGAADSSVATHGVEGPEAPIRLGLVLAFEAGRLASARVDPSAADGNADGLGALGVLLVDASARLARSLPPPGPLAERPFIVRIEVVR